LDRGDGDGGRARRSRPPQAGGGGRRGAARATELAHADPAIAARAAAALGVGKAVRSPRAFDALLDALALGVHPDVAVAALGALARHGKPAAMDTVEFYASYRTAGVRAAAVAAAGAIGGSRGTSVVLASLRDGDEAVRAAGAEAVRQRKLAQGVEPLVALIRRGDAVAAPVLAAMADANLARIVAEQIGSAPDAVVARCLGAILMRADFQPEDARVQVVHALGKIPGGESLEQLTNYVASLPENPPRASRRDAEAIIEQRLSGGN
jgi:HEAT repeat protein